MGIIFDLLGSICAPQPYEVVEHQSDFCLEPIKAIYRDYTPVNVLRMGWCNERGTGGKSRKAVVHARCDRTIGKRSKGELLCGYKSKAKYGGDLYSVNRQVDCPKCKQLVEGLEESLLLSSNYGWFT